MRADTIVSTERMTSNQLQIGMVRQTDKTAESRMMKMSETERGRFRFRIDERIIWTIKKMIPHATAGQKTYVK